MEHVADTLPLPTLLLVDSEPTAGAELGWPAGVAARAAAASAAPPWTAGAAREALDSCRELPQGVVALKSSSDTSSRSIAAAFFDFFMSVSVSAPCRAPHAAVRAPGGAPQAQPSRARPPRACASRCPLQPPTSGIGSEIPIMNQRKDVISVL